MRRTVHLMLTIVTLLARSAWAQSAPASQRSAVQFVPSDTNLQKGYIQLAVRDARSNSGISYALICLDLPRPEWVVTDPSGGVRVGRLPSLRLQVRVLAPGFAPETLIVDPSDEGRRQAIVQLTRRENSNNDMSCAQNPAPTIQGHLAFARAPYRERRRPSHDY